jgi:hypothetical protein
MMMAKDRRDRYRTPDEAVIDLKRMLDGRKPLLARTDSRISVLTDAAKWEDTAATEAPGGRNHLYIRNQRKWGAKREAHIPTSMKILIAVLAFMAILFSTLYVIERMKP